MNLPRVDKYIIVILILAGLALAIQEAYVWKDLANLWDTDLISYIDNGEAFWRGDFNHFVNLYWSPLYGILVALVLKLAGSTIDNELLLTRATNLVIYGIVCLSFLYFVETLKHFLQKRFKNEERACLESYWGLSLLTLTAVFFYSTLTLGQTMYGTPDMLSTCFAFLVSALALRQAEKLENKETLALKDAIFLAIAGALAYLSKAPLFPYAISTLLGLLLAARRVKQARGIILTSLAALVFLYSPYIAIISTKAGHLTFSDVFKVGQCWNIFAKQPITHGRSPSFLHPTRIFAEKPEAYEFDDDLNVTYSPWYAPCYWYAGVQTIIEWPAYINRVLVNASRYCLFFVIGASLFWLVALKNRLPLVKPIESAFLWLPPAAGLGFMLFGMDMSVNTDRYYSPYLVPLFASFFISLKSIPKEKSLKTLKALTYVIATFSILRMGIFACSYSALFNTQSRQEGFRVVEIPAAKLLRQSGLKPGDKIAQIGSCRYYFARLAKLKIVADFTKPAQFWQLPEQEQKVLIDRLKKLKIKALIQEPYLKEVPLSINENDLPRPNDQRLKNWLTLAKTEKGWELVPAYQAKEEKWNYPSTFMILKLD